MAQAFDKGYYSFSLGNSTSDGIIPNTGMDRYNVKLNATANLSQNWTTGFSGNFITSKIKKQSSGNEGVVATIYGAPSSYDFNGIRHTLKVILTPRTIIVHQHLIMRIGQQIIIHSKNALSAFSEIHIHNTIQILEQIIIV